MEVTPGVTVANLLMATATNFQNLVNNATFAAGKVTDFEDENRPIYKAGSQVESPPTGQIWMNTNPDGFFSLLYYDGAASVPLASGFSATNLSGSDMQLGDAVQVESAQAGFVTPDATAFAYHGILGADTDNGDVGPIIMRGIAYVRQWQGTPTNGGYILANDTGGVKVIGNSTAGTSAVFGRVLDTTNQIVYVCGRLQA